MQKDRQQEPERPAHQRTDETGREAGRMAPAERRTPDRGAADRAVPAERARRPVPGVKHEPEPDAENIMPAEDEPGTL